jgi:isopentenyl phosphate kinase
VWYQASALNRYVMDALHTADVPALALAPVASVTARDGQVAVWDLSLLTRALEAGLVPVVYGDVIFDEARGGTILSTEDLFLYLARQLRPRRILLAGLEAGVWADFPARKRLLNEIRPEALEKNRDGLGGAAGVDVTGGMQTKVEQMLYLVQQVDGLEVRIFSGEADGAIERALAGEPLGTRLHVFPARK